MRAALLGVPLTLIGFVTACGDVPNSPNTNEALAPSPVALSSIVDRFDLSDGALLPIFPELGITFSIGLVTPIDELTECGGSEALVFDSRGPVRNLTRIQGTVVLYDALLDITHDFCELAPTEVGRGTGILIRTDNDVNVEGPGADSFGGTLTAILDLTSGGRASLVLVTRVVILPDGSFETVVDRFELQPIGG
jgi:hypothetical protein